MKRIISFLMAVILLCMLMPMGIAETDYSFLDNMTMDELNALNAEVEKRISQSKDSTEVAGKYAVDGEKTILIDRPDFVLSLSGTHEAFDNCNGISGNYMFNLDCVIENKGDKVIDGVQYNGIINGWSLGSNFTMMNTNGIQPGTKVKTYIWFTTEDTEVSSFEALESMNLTFVAKDEDYKDIFTETTGIVYFHANAEDVQQANAEETSAEVTETPAQSEATVTDTEAPTENEAVAETATVEYEKLEVGSRGDAVVALQKHLIALGYLTGSADGVYGKGTAGGVSKFQKAEGLSETGVADSETQAKLFAKELPEKQVVTIIPGKLSVNSAGTTELYVRFRNDGTETIDRLDFYVECFNTYDEKIKGYGRYDYSDNYYEASPNDYYSGSAIKPGATTANDWYWGLYGFDGTSRVKVAVHKYHTTEGNTVVIPESKLHWVEFE